MHKLSYLICLLLLSVACAFCQDETASSYKDHPSVPGFPGYAIDNEVVTDFDAAEFHISAEGMKKLEGRSWNIGYAVKEGARLGSPLEITRNYANQFKAKGGRVVYQQVDSGGGTATMSMPLGSGERWLQLDLNNNGEQYRLQIIETAEMKQKVEFSADQMAAELAASGKVTLRGILFDSGKSEIKPESNPILDEIAKMLKADQALKLAIEGHTDNVGAKAANLALSKSRAAAVKTALTSRGIAADNLTTAGFGDTKPVAPNATEDGKAQNRRVELIKK